MRGTRREASRFPLRVCLRAQQQNTPHRRRRFRKKRPPLIMSASEYQTRNDRET